MDLPWLNGLNRPAQKKRIPSVLTREEVATLFSLLDREMALLATVSTTMIYTHGLKVAAGGATSPLDASALPA